MRNELVETLLEGLAFGVAVLFAISSGIIFAGGTVSEFVPSMIVDNAKSYGMLGFAIAVVSAIALFSVLKKFNSKLSKGLLAIGGGLGIVLCGIQVVIAHGNFVLIGISFVFGYICYIIITKSLKR